MSRHTGSRFVTGVNVISVEETEEMCQGTSVHVVSISYGVVYGGTYMWLEWCPLGCLAHVCSGVCARSVRWRPQKIDDEISTSNSLNPRNILSPMAC